jgi:hypothetical protein
VRFRRQRIRFPEDGKALCHPFDQIIWKVEVLLAVRAGASELRRLRQYELEIGMKQHGASEETLASRPELDQDPGIVDYACCDGMAPR